MQIRSQIKLSRRTVLFGAIAAKTLLHSQNTLSKQATPAQTQGIGNGIEVVDYRLFPTEDVMRFIVEIRNTTENAVDTPTVGVTLPNLASGENFGWAAPVSSILHPNASGCLIGVAPPGLRTDEDWEDTEWILCHEVSTGTASVLDTWDITFEDRFEIVGPEHARALVDVTNNSDAKPTNLRLQGLVRDDTGRVCGAMPTASLAYLNPGQTAELTINLIPSLEYVANPFALIDSAEGIDISFSLQVPLPSVNSGCPRVAPWNR